MDIGRVLLEARRQQGLTLEEIQELTKIQKRYLIAIEDEDFDIMPGQFYTRAFIRQYAEVLQINPEPLLAQFDAETQRLDDENAVVGSAHHRSKEKEPTVLSRVNWAVLGLLLTCSAILLAIVWAAMSLDRPAQQPDVASATISNQSTIQDVSSQVSESQSVASSSQSSEPVKTTLEPESIDGEVVRYEPQSLTADETLVLSASNETWVSVTADGEELFAGTLNTGQKESITIVKGTELLVIRVGYAPATAVQFGGKTVEIGEFAETQTLVFNLFYEE